MKIRAIPASRLIGCLFFLVIASPASAQQTDVAQHYNSFMSLFANTAHNWQPVLVGYANRIFWILALIDLIVVFFPLAFRGSEMGEIVGELVRFVLIIGFFYLLLMKGPVWANDIVQSLRQASAKAGGSAVALSPGDLLLQGFKIAAKMTTHISVFSPGDGIALVAAWIVLILAFSFMAAIVAVTLIESYVIIYGAVIFLGLGGSRFTRDYAITVLRYALAVGAKLFTITLVVNLIKGAFDAWAHYWDNTLTSATALMGLAIVAALVTKMVPDLVQSMISGQSGVGNHIGGMATTALAAGAAAASGGMLGAAAAGGMAGGGAGALGGMGGGPVSGGAALGEAMQSSMMQRPGLSPGLGGGGPMPGAASPGGVARPAATAAPRGASPMAGGSPAAGGKRHAAFKTVGTMAELVVPGMEGASAVGVAPQPGPMPDLTPGGDGDFASSDAPAMTATPVDESVIETPKST